MNNIPYTAWLVLTLVVAVPTILAVWSRRPSRARTWSIVAFLAASPMAAAGLGLTLGWPVPLINGVTVPAGEVDILGAKMLVDQGIYILLDRGADVPRYVYRPWDPKLADQLQQAMDETIEGLPKMTVPPFEWSWSQKPPKFYALPQPKVLPDKIEPPDAPEFDSDQGI